MDDPKHTTTPNGNNRAQPKSTHEDELTAPTGNHSRIGKKALFFGALSVIAIILFALVNHHALSAFADRIGDVLFPIILGCVIAYLCNPILEFYEYRVLRHMRKTELRRGLSLLLAVLTAAGVIALILLMIIPELTESITNLIHNYRYYMDTLLDWINGVVHNIAGDIGFEINAATVEQKLTEFFGSSEEIMNKIMSWITDGNIIGNVSGAVMDIFGTVTDIVLGIFIAFYILSSKEKRIAQVRKFRRAVFSEKRDEQITDVIRLANHTFSGFIFGVLIDALVVGILTFTLLTIFEVSPYNLLIATFCAVTNIIPVFGPFIGAIPSAFIVLISNPSKLLLFIFLILVIQQIDGNILCPKIQGDNTGVSSLAVLVAITIFGSMWGIFGMVIGVPICAVIIEMFKRFLEVRLQEKGEPIETEAYYPANALGNAEKDLHYEHAALRYKFEHSRLKRWLDKRRRKKESVREKGKDKKK